MLPPADPRSEPPGSTGRTPPPRPAAVTTRLATVADAEALREIYNLEVTTSVVTFDIVPRTPAEQRRWLEARSGAHAVIVAEDDHGDIAGFASLSPYRDRPAYSTSVEDSIYVRRDRQRQGIGKLLLGDLIDLAVTHGFHAMFARIVGSHATGSIGLHESFGFETVGTEREVGRKFGRWLDVVVMEKLL